jgi:hypothetical protein
MSGRSSFRSFLNRKQWLIPYLLSLPFKRRVPDDDPGPQHILFSFVDHFEPGHGGVEPARQKERVEQWRRSYPEVVCHFGDCEGNHPRHTWFYLGEEPEHLRLLSELCFQGFGEVELHLHHGVRDRIPNHWKQQDLLGLAGYIKTQKNWFADYGALITGEREPQKVFGFIHGMFALDDSLPEYCGVPGELQLLKSLGCYGDFSFPAPGKSQPPLINKLYYPTGNPGKRCSYFRGEEVRVGSIPRDEVLIFQGPLGLVWQGLVPHIEDGHVDWEHRPTRNRVLFWISRGIHVQGRPEWVFVKVYIHGAMENNVRELSGDLMGRLHSILQDICRKETAWSLHYTSARESFNIAMAAMAGEKGDPGRFRDYVIPAYANTVISCNRPYRLGGYTRQGWSVQLVDALDVILRVKGEVETEITADFLEQVSISLDSHQRALNFQAEGKGVLTLRLKNLKGTKVYLGPENPEGEVHVFGPVNDSSVSFSGTFSARGAMKAHFGIGG